MSPTGTAPLREPLKVLLVEDNPADARLVQEWLGEVAPKAIALTHAARLRQALAFLQDQGFNAILLDLKLPDSEGLATFTAARALAPNAPIIVLTALQDEELAAQAMRDGAQDYLVKGHVDGATLYQSIRFAIERHHFEESLRASEARYRGLVEGSIQAILIHVDGTIRLANPALARLLGIDSPEACIGAKFFEFIAPEDRERVEEVMQACLEGRPAATRYECNIVTRKGARGSVDCIVSLIRWDREPAILATMVDSTELSRAEEALRLSEEQLRHAQKMEAVGRLAGGIAHDFNNLLTVITSYAELLLREADAGDPVTRSDLHEIQNAALTAATLTRQLLAFSRQQVLQPRVLSLNEVVVASENLLRRLIGEDIKVHITLDPDEPRVRADAGQLEQVLLNLAVNARDAMPDGGDLVIETSTSEVVTEPQPGQTPDVSNRYAVVMVSDTGIGMDAETRAHIFEPFFTTKESGKGTGLGLSTVYAIVRQCGGMVKVHSEPARGSTFRVYLPYVAEAADSVVTTPRSTNVLGTETLLLVEDAAAVRFVLRRALERYGYTILEAPDGNTALALASRYHGNIDLLLTDAVLPELSGRHVAERLREVRTGLRVLFISGYAGDALVSRSELEAWASYLQKPFTPEELARKVRQVLAAP